MATDPIPTGDCSTTTASLDVNGGPVSDSNPMPVDVVSGSVTLDASDIEIGAVEIKDATSVNRAAVNASGQLAVTDTAAETSLSTINTSTAAVSTTTGATTDAAVVTDSNGTLSGKLRGIIKLLAEGSAKVITRGGAKGATVAADVTSTASGADHQGLDVGLYDGSGNLLGGTTTPIVIRGPAAAGAALSGNPVLLGGSDGTNVRVPRTVADNADTLTVDTVAELLRVVAEQFVFNGTSWDRARSDGTTGGQGIGGTIAAAAADSGNPVKIGGKYNTSPPTLTNGQRGDAQLDVNANLMATLATLVAGEDITNAVLGTLMKPVASSTYSPSSFQDFGTATTFSVKASAGNVYALAVSNANAAVRYMQLHNKASAPAGGDTAAASYLIPAGTAAAPAIREIPSVFFSPSYYLSTGIGLAISTTATTYTAATNGDHTVAVRYV